MSGSTTSGPSRSGVAKKPAVSRGDAASADTGGPRGTVVLDAERCKGCELCVPACPPRVLRMSTRRNASGYVLPELLEGCTGCGACLMVCPDFCFEIYRFESEGTPR